MKIIEFCRRRWLRSALSCLPMLCWLCASTEPKAIRSFAGGAVLAPRLGGYSVPRKDANAKALERGVLLFSVKILTSLCFTIDFNFLIFTPSIFAPILSYHSCLLAADQHFNSLPFKYFSAATSEAVFTLKLIELSTSSKGKLSAKLCFFCRRARCKIDNQQTWLLQTFLIHRRFLFFGPTRKNFCLSCLKSGLGRLDKRPSSFFARYQWCGNISNMIYGSTLSIAPSSPSMALNPLAAQLGWRNLSICTLNFLQFFLVNQNKFWQFSSTKLFLYIFNRSHDSPRPTRMNTG